MKLGTLTSWNPLGHYKAVTGLLLEAFVYKSLIHMRDEILFNSK